MKRAKWHYGVCITNTRITVMSSVLAETVVWGLEQFCEIQGGN